MVQVEGSGCVKPAIQKLILSNGEIRTLIVEAKKRESHRRYADRSDSWGRGMMNTIVIPNVGSVDATTAPILAGLVGEYGVACFINRRCGDVCRVDTSLRTSGDGGIDLSPRGLKIDAKTRTKDYGNHLIRAVRDNGLRVDWKCEVFVFCQWEFFRTVELHGFAWARPLLAKPVVAARAGRHGNVEVEPHELLPMSRLVDEIRSRE